MKIKYFCLALLLTSCATPGAGGQGVETLIEAYKNCADDPVCVEKVCGKLGPEARKAIGCPAGKPDPVTPPGPTPPGPNPIDPQPVDKEWKRQHHYTTSDFPGSIESGKLELTLKNVGNVYIKDGSLFLHMEGFTDAGNIQNLHAMFYSYDGIYMVRFVRHYWDLADNKKLYARHVNHSLPVNPDKPIHIVLRWNDKIFTATLTHGPHVRVFKLPWVEPMATLNFANGGEGIYPGRNGKPIGRNVLTRFKITIEVNQ